MTEPDNATFNPSPSTEQIEDARHVVANLKALVDWIDHRIEAGDLDAARFAIADKESEEK